jgi:hypothetical protein
VQRVLVDHLEALGQRARDVGARDLQQRPDRGRDEGGSASGPRRRAAAGPARSKTAKAARVGSALARQRAVDELRARRRHVAL